MLLVCMAKNAVWALEQPANSLLERSTRFDWLVNHVAFVSWLSIISYVCHSNEVMIHHLVMYIGLPMEGGLGACAKVLDATSRQSYAKANSAL